jgi:hypothetical protein
MEDPFPLLLTVVVARRNAYSSSFTCIIIDTTHFFALLHLDMQLPDEDPRRRFLHDYMRWLIQLVFPRSIPWYDQGT